MHLYDPHRPYSAESTVNTQASGQQELSALPDPCLYSQQPQPDLPLAVLLATASPAAGALPCDDRTSLASNLLGYQNEVRRADAAVGELVDWLEQRGELDTTAILVTADHGELFGEAGYFGHGPIMHEKCFEVPFLEGKLK